MEQATTLKPRDFTPKRGIKNLKIKLVDKAKEFKPHHQKTLILELLDKAEKKEMELKDMIAKVEADENLWKRLNSKQSVFNCITFHVKDLAKLGVLATKE